MSRADLIVSLVKAGSQGDQQLLRTTVEAMAAEERAKHHHQLADKLKQSKLPSEPERTELKTAVRKSFEARQALQRAELAELGQRIGQHACHAMHALGDGLQTFRPVIHRIHARDDSEQHLRGADVRRGLLAADVLLARLESEA